MQVAIAARERGLGRQRCATSLNAFRGRASVSDYAQEALCAVGASPEPIGITRGRARRQAGPGATADLVVAGEKPVASVSSEAKLCVGLGTRRHEGEPRRVLVSGEPTVSRLRVSFTTG